MIDESGKYTGCYKLMSVKNNQGAVVNFIVEPSTYFVDHVMVAVGDSIVGFYDANVPVPMIYPPQYRAVVITKVFEFRNVKVDYFDSDLVSSDNTLKLNPASYTQIVLQNDQLYNRVPTNRELIVIYGITTKYAPAETTPYKIIVMC